MLSFEPRSTSTLGPSQRFMKGTMLKSDAVLRTQTGATSTLGWSSTYFAVDFYQSEVLLTPHTLLFFVPGNPGLVDWYVDFFADLVSRLGPGYAARGLSHAGHSVDPNHHTPAYNREALINIRDTSIPWTIDGQVSHKMAYLDEALRQVYPSRDDDGHDHQEIRLIFVAHSIGAHIAQRIAIMRPDLLLRTRMFLFLTPFIRMKAPWRSQLLLNQVGARPDLAIAVASRLMRLCQALPASWVNAAMRSQAQDDAARNLATKLVRTPQFAAHFFRLGAEEVRDVPEEFDVSGLRLLCQNCPVALLYAGQQDPWGPAFHIDDLNELQSHGLVTTAKTRQRLRCTLIPSLQHDFITNLQQVQWVVDYCVEQIQSHPVAFECRGVRATAERKQVEESELDTPRSRL